MPFPMKIQPVDFSTVEEPTRYDSFKPVPKSRFKRLFERQFSGLLRSSAPEKLVTGEDLIGNKKDASEEFEPSSICLAKMVQTFIEEGEDKHRCNRSRCNCFNCNGTESSEEEADSVNCFGESNQNCCGDACEILKSLVSCPSIFERNVLADITKIIEKNRMIKRKDNFIRKMVVDGLVAEGYDVSICESRWEKAPSIPAGKVILEAVILTAAVVISLTLYTFWAAKRGQDFNFLGPFLFGALIVLLLFSFIQILFPLGKISVMIYGCLASIIFCGYIVYDTDNLIKRYTYDEYIWAAISLYLDVINLFLSLLTLFRAADS